MFSTITLAGPVMGLGVVSADNSFCGALGTLPDSRVSARSVPRDFDTLGPFYHRGHRREDTEIVALVDFQRSARGLPAKTQRRKAEIFPGGSVAEMMGRG